MGGCCSKFGTYFVKKEEAKSGQGSSPKLNKLEHKTSFVAEKASCLKTFLINNDLFKGSEMSISKECGIY